MRQFNRNYNQRKALFKSQLRDLITWGKLTTTEAKAKAIKRIFDRLVAKAKTNSVAVRRQLAASLSSAAHAQRLVDVIAPLMSDHPSGFTSIVKVARRRGDNVVLATLKLVKDLPATPAPVVPAKPKVTKVKATKTK